jgi:hypothetical protein
MPYSFGPLPQPRSETGNQPNRLRGVTVTDRYVPLVPAAYGTRVARLGRRRGSDLVGTVPAQPEGEAVLKSRQRIVCFLCVAELSREVVHVDLLWLAVMAGFGRR